LDGKIAFGNLFFEKCDKISIGDEIMSNIKQLILENNFNFKKKYGQNFLVDSNVLNKIVALADIKEKTLVIEIGVGSGNLTKKIARYAKNVIGYEIDESLKPIISESLGEFTNIKVIYDDFLKRNLLKDLNDFNYSNIYVIANLPYYITTPIISKLIEDNISVDKMILMVQKEVADRISAKPDNKDYNSLTIFINYYFNVHKLFDVSKNVFIPKPNVDSTVIELEKKDSQYEVDDEELFFKIVRDSFTQKRKNLRNNLKNYNLQKIDEVLKKHNLDLTVRAEHLTIEEFIEIANNL
jgi:16S rRNA (adenine1518-N6/adenine1519-N6)-dimethyltransferase